MILVFNVILYGGYWNIVYWFILIWWKIIFGNGFFILNGIFEVIKCILWFCFVNLIFNFVVIILELFMDG